jgi:hypothetical protein
MAPLSGLANAVFIPSKSTMGPVEVLGGEDFVPVVWNGKSFFVPHPELFLPSIDAFYFFIRRSGSVEGRWYISVPENLRDSVRVSDVAAASILRQLLLIYGSF